MMIKIRSVFARPLKPGLTLIELLVAAALMVIVTGAGFTLFQIGARHEARQQDVLNQTQNLRAALYALARDARMAGNGFGFLSSPLVDIYVAETAKDTATQEAPGWGWFKYKGAAKYGVRPIYGVKGADDDTPDSLTIFRSEIESPLPLGQLGQSFTPGTDAFLSLKRNVKVGEVVSDGDILAVSFGSRTVVLQVSPAPSATPVKILPLGPRFKPEAPLPGGFTFPEGATVYNLRNVVFVTYYLDRSDKHNRLMANYHDGTLNVQDEGAANARLVAVAGNIENFKVEYFITKPGQEGANVDGKGVLEGLTGDIDEAALDEDGGKNVRLVSLRLRSRSSRPSATAGTTDKYVRMDLTENISLRNFNTL